MVVVGDVEEGHFTRTCCSEPVLFITPRSVDAGSGQNLDHSLRATQRICNWRTEFVHYYILLKVVALNDV